MVVRLWVPITQRLVARNWNWASSRRPRTTSMVPKRPGTSTPLAVIGSVVALTPASLASGCRPGRCDSDAQRLRLETAVLESWRATWRMSWRTPRHHGRVIFEFEDFELDTERFELRQAGQPRQVEPQVFDVLRYLVEHRDRVVTKEELLDNVWGDRFVSESALTSRIKAARQALGDSGRQQRFIAHRPRPRVPLPPVGRVPGGRRATSPRSGRDIRYARSGDVNIAYELTGDGPIDIVLDRRLRLPPRDRLGGPALGRVPGAPRGHGPADPVRQAGDRPVRSPSRPPRPRDPHGRRAGGDGRGRQRAGGGLRRLRGRADGRALRRDVPGPHAKPSCSTAPTPGGSAPTTTRGPRRSRSAWSTPRRPRPSGASGPTCSACARTPTTRWPTGGSAGRGRPPVPAAARALIEMNSLIDIRDVLPTISVPTLVIHRRG